MMELRKTEPVFCLVWGLPKGFPGGPPPRFEGVLLLRRREEEEDLQCRAGAGVFLCRSHALWACRLHGNR